MNNQFEKAVKNHFTGILHNHKINNFLISDIVKTIDLEDNIAVRSKMKVILREIFLKDFPYLAPTFIGMIY